MRVAGKSVPHLPAPNELYTVTVTSLKTGKVTTYRDQWEDAANRMKGILENRRKTGEITYTIEKQS